MALSSAVISFDIADLLGNDFAPAKTKVSVTTNVPDGVIADTVGNQIRVGDGTVQIGADGTGTVSVWIPGTGSNPASWQTYIHLDAAPSRAGVGRVPKTFGPFTITGDANLADLIAEQEVPPTYLGAAVATLQALIDEALSVTGISTSDALIETLVKGTGGAGPLTRAALAATFVRFVDSTTGDPVTPTGTVLIKVDTATGEIDDIVFEEV